MYVQKTKKSRSLRGAVCETIAQKTKYRAASDLFQCKRDQPPSPATPSVRGELNTSAVDRRAEPGGNSRTTFWEEEEEKAGEDAEEDVEEDAEEDASPCRASLCAHPWCTLGEATVGVVSKVSTAVYLLCKTPIRRTFQNLLLG